MHSLKILHYSCAILRLRNYSAQSRDSGNAQHNS